MPAAAAPGPTVTDVCCVAGLAVYYRKFVQHFSTPRRPPAYPLQPSRSLLSLWPGTQSRVAGMGDSDAEPAQASFIVWPF